MHDLVHDLALDLSKHHSVTVKEGHELNHVSKAIYVRIDEGVLKIKPTIPNTRVQTLYAWPRIFGDVLPYLKHLTVLVLYTDEVTNELPSSLCKMKYLKQLDISCFRSKLPSCITELYNLQTLKVWNLDELPQKFCNLINLRHLFTETGNANTRCMFTGIERLICLQTLPHFVVSRDHNCHVGHLGWLKNLRGKLELYGLDDIENMEEASKASLCTKSNIERLQLAWSNDEDGKEEIEYNDEYVMEGLKPHANLKGLRIDYFKGKKLASWITMMTNLADITLRDCNRCEGFPPLGQLPKLRRIDIIRMDNVKVFGIDFCGGLGTNSSELSDDGGEAKRVTIMYPSLTKLFLWDLPNLEEWVEPVISVGGEDQSTVQVFPKLEVLDIKFCSKLTRIPSSCFPSLKKLEIANLDSSKILETMSRKVSSLTFLQLRNISDGGEGSSSNMNSIIDELLKNNSQSLTTLNLCNCQGLTCLTLGVSLEGLEVSIFPDLTTINVVEESCCLKYLKIKLCPSLSDWVFAKSVRSTLVRLILGPFYEELDEFPWPFSSSFPNLISLELWGSEKLKSILPTWQLDDRLSSFPALTRLAIIDFEGVKALPDSLTKFPSLRELYIRNCKNLESLPTFDESDSLQCLEIYGCPIVKERCRKGSGSEWFKIQHIPLIYW